MATLREGWVMPDAPVEVCPACKEQVIPTLYHDGEDDVWLAMQCEGGCTHEEIEWPFVEIDRDFDANLPTDQDFKDLGFTILYY